MNRLVIIGNGFDLAHGLPTGYSDFIDDYWRNVVAQTKSNYVYEDELFSVKAYILNNDSYERSDWDKYVKDYDSMIDIMLEYKTIDFKFKNDLLRIISNHSSNSNWVDVENIYITIY